jgi:hypothetical protein
MKKLSFLLGIIIVISGCSERKMLRNAEKYLKDHIGDYKSYSRIEWKIADTIFINDLKNTETHESIENEKWLLEEGKHVQIQQQSIIHELRLRNPALQELLPRDKGPQFGRMIDAERSRYGQIVTYTYEEELEMKI